MTRISLSFYCIAVLIAAIVANLLVLEMNTRDLDSQIAGWQPVQVAPNQPEVETRVIEMLLGVVRDQAETATNPVSQISGLSSTIGSFSYEGVVYRLTGLIVDARGGAVTLIGEGGEPMRLEQGDYLLGVGRIEAIRLNELIVTNAEGGRESITIYQ